MTIINEYDFTFSPSEQTTLRNAMANLGINTIYCRADETPPSDICEFYDEDDHYVFSLNRETEEIFDK